MKPIVLALAVSLASCATLKNAAEVVKDAVVECGKAELIASTNWVLPSVVAVIGGAPTADFLEAALNFLAGAGKEAVACAVARIGDHLGRPVNDSGEQKFGAIAMPDSYDFAVSWVKKNKLRPVLP